MCKDTDVSFIPYHTGVTIKEPVQEVYQSECFQPNPQSISQE